MFKVNNNLILSGLILSAILAFGIISLPGKTFAQYAGYSSSCDGTSGYGGGTCFSDNGSSNFGNSYNPPAYYQAPVYYAPPAPAPTLMPTTIYSSATNPNAVPATHKTVAKATTPNTTNTSNTSDLAANAEGAGNFMPTGIIGWILFAILILIIVILVRKVFGGEKRYHAAPLKHD